MKHSVTIEQSKGTESSRLRSFIFTAPDRAIFYCSEATCSLLGLESSSLFDINAFFDLIHESDQMVVMDQYHSCIHGDQRDCEVEFRLKADHERKLHLFIQQEAFDGSRACLLMITTAEKLAEQTLIVGDYDQRKEYLANYFGDIGYWEYDPSKGLLECSSHVYKLLNLTAKKKLSLKDFLHAVTPEGVVRFETLINSLKPGNPGFNIELDHLIHEKFVHLRCKGFSIWRGEYLVKIVGIFENVTERRGVEERLELVEKASKTGWYEINDQQGSSAIVSKSFLKMHGFNFHDRMPTLNELLACVHPDDHERIIRFRKATYDSFDGWSSFEYRVVMPDGAIKYIESTGHAVVSPATHEVMKVIATIKDVSELRLKEIQLSQANEMAHLGWYERDLKKGTLEVSAEFLKIHELDAYDPEKLKDKVHEEDVHVLDEIDGAYTRHDGAYSFQYRIVLSTGGYRYIQNSGQSAYDPISGHAIKVAGTVQDISGFKSLEQRLQRAQKMSHTGWFEYDIINPTASSFSNEWLDMHDFDSQPKGLSAFLDKIHPNDRKVIPSLTDFLRSMPDEWANLDYRIITRYGHKRYISNSSKVLYKDGIPSKVFGTTIDVTGTRVTERALKDSERKYRLMSENSRDAILLLEVKDDRYLISFASDYVQELTGYSKYDLLGMEVIQLMYEEDKKWVSTEVFPQLMQDGESTAASFRLSRSDNQFVWVEANIGVLIEETPVKLQLSLRDISERKAFEEKLLKSNNDLKAMIKATEDIVYIIKPDFTFEGVIVNDENKLEKPVAAFTGRSIEQLWNDDNGQVMCRLVRSTFQTGKSHLHDFTQTISGQFDWYRAHTHAFMGYDQQERVSVMVEKVTTQKRAEEELRKTMEMERELARMRSSFVSMASHQFRTPLTVIKSNMQLLELSGKDDPIIRKVSDRLTREVGRMVGLMEDILMLGKIQSGAIMPRFSPMKMTELLQSIKSDVDVVQTDGRFLELQVTGEERIIDQDEGLMRQAVLNLITNAFKYSPDCPNPVVTIDYSDTLQLSVSVKDFGLGINEENLSRIFKDFYRSDRVSHIPGTGLGLSVTSAFLKVLNCKINVASEVGAGAEFVIRIPTN